MNFVKNIPLLLAFCVFISCIKKEDKMLYDYQQKNVKSLNFDLDDLDFKIKNIRKIADIRAEDSIKILKIEFANYWTNKPTQGLVDTLSFDYVKKELGSLIDLQKGLYKDYTELLLGAIRIGDYSGEFRYREEKDKISEDLVLREGSLSKIKDIEVLIGKLSKNPDSIVSSKYRATYSMKNPMLGSTKQTFDKIFYTNPTQTEFVSEEEIIEN